MKKPSIRPTSPNVRPRALPSDLAHSPYPLRGGEGGASVEEEEDTDKSPTEGGRSFERYGVIVPCPNCGAVQYTVGPLGLPERECWGCGQAFTPEIRQIDEVEDIVEWWKVPAKYAWTGTIKELVEGLAAGKPLKLTIATVPVLPEPRPIEGRKRCPGGHICMHEPSGSFACCRDTSGVDRGECPCDACQGVARDD